MQSTRAILRSWLQAGGRRLRERLRPARGALSGGWRASCVASFRASFLASFLALGLTLASLPPAKAMTGIFWQPQLRDRQIADADWTRIFVAARGLGFDTLVLQWTRHGPAFAEGDERAWLEARVHQARETGLRLLIGLAADPDYFSRIEQADEALDGYLRRLAVDDAALARSWVDTLGAEAIGGWYLPGEIDDLHWRSSQRAGRLEAWLADSVTRLGEVLDRPVYVSAFFTGKMHPARYASLLGSLQRTGVRLWVQDGRGTGVLTEAEIRLYLTRLLDCEAFPVDAVIHELFVQKPTKDGSFVAHGIGPAKTAELLNALPPCRGRRIFFSLRYLPGIDALMGTPIATPAEVSTPAN